MGSYVIRRFMYGLITLLLVSIVIFSIIHILPGDPIRIMFGDVADTELIEQVRRQYGLDDPVLVQYIRWLGNVIQGNLGYSVSRGGMQVSELILPRVGRSVVLALVGLFFSVSIAVTTGIAAARHHNTWKDFSISSITLVLISVPEFWIGIIYMMVFAVWLRWLPASGFVPMTQDLIGFFRAIILPAMAIASVRAAQTARMVRTNALEVMRLDYITFMRSLGVSEKRLMNKHVLKNVLLPVLTQIGMQAASLMGGVVIIERVFSFPGLGLLMMQSLQSRDYPVLQASILVFSVFAVLFNLLVDILYSFVNPKVRY